MITSTRIEIIKKVSDLNNTMIERKNTLKGIISTVEEAEEKISDLENRVVESHQTESQKEKGFLKTRVG